MLTGLSCFWFELTKDIFNNHFITVDIEPLSVNVTKYRNILESKTILVEKFEPLQVGRNVKKDHQFVESVHHRDNSKTSEKYLEAYEMITVRELI